MASPRFFLDSIPETGSCVLDSESSVHAASVLRMEHGDSLTLFDGRGTVAEAKIQTVSKRGTRVEIESIRELASPTKYRLQMLVALPKGDRQRVLVDGLNQLGVDRLTPVQCERSVAQPSTSTLKRLRKTVIESCKQSRRDLLMEVGDPVNVSELSAVDWATDGPRLLAHPYQTKETLSELNTSSVEEIQCLVGPEGGLSEDEVQLLCASGWSPVSLGENILRVETAALAVAAYLVFSRMSDTKSEIAR